MFLAGSDTTSATVEWAMTELVKNPAIMKKAQEEARRIVGNKSKIEDSDVNQMEYMKCVIKETLRMHPAGPLLAPERFENNKVDFNGQNFQFIPFGSGRRKCPGMAFGLASTEYMLANLLYWFDWKLPTNGASLQDIDMTEKFGITVTKKVPLCLQPIAYNNFQE